MHYLKESQPKLGVKNQAVPIFFHSLQADPRALV